MRKVIERSIWGLVLLCGLDLHSGQGSKKHIAGGAIIVVAVCMIADAGEKEKR